MAMKLDSRPDAMMLECACMAYEASARAYIACAELGDVVKEPIVDATQLRINAELTQLYTDELERLKAPPIAQPGVIVMPSPPDSSSVDQGKRIGILIQALARLNEQAANPSYRLKKNPWVSVRERSLLLVKTFCSEFGLSPVSRTRLSIEKRDSGEADLAALLSAPREKRTPPETVN